MAHFAKVVDDIVTQVIVAEPEFFDTFVDETPGEWIQTSYNTIGGQHVNGGTPLRKNYASVGGIYDSTRDAFIPPKLYPSWVLNEDSCLWEAPVSYPDADSDERYEWNEENQTWDEI
jgi:hypothetical protein